MNAYLRQLAHASLDRRDAEYEKIKTPDQVAQHAKRMRALLVDQLGGFPERTPLNARMAGRVEGDGYRIEKIIYESQPRHYVTAHVYLPVTDGPHPAVLMLCGHQLAGVGKEVYRDLCILLVKNGFAAMCFDTLGQGERHQVLTPDGQPRFYASLEHMMAGIGSILVGRNAATYIIWDGIRAIDYLVSRDDVDPERIGCTGGSGGGTQTAYLMALEPRVRCAAPRNYMTSLRRLIDTIGPQDAEQNIHRQIAEGMGHGDFIMMFAPKPVLLLVTTQDDFDIHGAWETFREAKRIYTRLGVPERVDLVEGDAGHRATPEMQTGLVRWMRRWLMGIDDAQIVEHHQQTEHADPLHCTERGQVMLMPGARSVFELNAELESRLAKQRRRFWQTATPGQALARIREIAGIRPLAALPPLAHETIGSHQQTGVRVDELLLQPEEGIDLPALAFVPAEPGGDAYLYLHGEGRHADAGPGAPIEALALAGHLVLAVDLRGIGQRPEPTRNADYAELFGESWRDVFLAYMLGKTTVGMRAEDVLVCARFCATYEAGETPHRVHLVGIGETGPPVLHAAVLEPDLFASVELRRSLVSWSDVVHTPVTRNQLVNAIHGALKTYDLPDLIAVLSTDKVAIVDPRDAAGDPVRSGG